MAHESLESYFKTNFALMQHHKYSLSEIENMMPFERQVYVSLLQQYMEQLKQEQKQQQYSGGGGGNVPQINAEKYVSKQKMRTLGIMG